MSDRTTATRGIRTNVQKAAAIVGGVFLLVGVLGFIPGITTNFGDLSFAGHNSDDFLHLILGIGMVGLGLALTRDRGGLAAPLAENAGGGDDQRYEKDHSATNTARWRTGFDPGRHRLVSDRTKGVVALSLIALPAQAAGIV